MLDHVSIAVADIARSIAFYEEALAPLGDIWLNSYSRKGAEPDHVGFGGGHMPYLWIGRGEPILGYAHVNLAAPDRAAVGALYQAAMAAGGRDNGKPGPRPHYHERYYGAFVLNPDGCNLAAVHQGF